MEHVACNVAQSLLQNRSGHFPPGGGVSVATHMADAFPDDDAPAVMATPGGGGFARARRAADRNAPRINCDGRAKSNVKMT